MYGVDSIFDKTRLNIFTGAYGSGKSEISVNCAIGMRKRNPESKVLLADLDIVNPFYRSSDAVSVLKENNIRVVAPEYAGTNVDVPALGGEIYVVFDDPEYLGVFDVGGEDMGARVLGSMKTRLAGMSYSLFMVINTLRPFTSDPEETAGLAYELSEAAQLPVTGLINNTNLLEETGAADVIDGDKLVRRVAELTGIPVAATVLTEDFAARFPEITKKCTGEVLLIDRYIRYAY